MIRGIGIDITDISRIGKMIERYGSTFLGKVFTENEIVFCRRKAIPEIHFSGRWAAKEAFYKALPQSCQSYSFWKSIEILSSVDSCRPEIVICSDVLQEVLQKEGISNFHVTISHEKKSCIAMVIIE